MYKVVIPLSKLKKLIVGIALVSALVAGVTLVADNQTSAKTIHLADPGNVG